jgi:multisubunit Na+/H+ antiporter MnhF subunit
VNDFLVALHRISATALVIFAVLLAVWGTYLYFRHAAVNGGFRSSFLIMAGLTAVQGLFGVVLLLLGNRPADWPLHIVYGIFAVAFLPGVYRYAQGGTKRREAVFLAGAAWIVAIAYVRGFMTG